MLMSSLVQYLQIKDGPSMLSFGFAWPYRGSIRTTISHLSDWRSVLDVLSACIQAVIASPTVGYVIYELVGDWMEAELWYPMAVSFGSLFHSIPSDSPFCNWVVSSFKRLKAFLSIKSDKNRDEGPDDVLPEDTFDYDGTRAAFLEEEERRVALRHNRMMAETRNPSQQQAGDATAQQARSTTPTDPPPVHNEARNSPPRSPEATVTDDPNDARIRISSHDLDDDGPGVVNLEIELPATPRRRASISTRNFGGTQYLGNHFHMSTLTQAAPTLLGSIVTSVAAETLMIPLRSVVLWQLSLNLLRTHPESVRAAEERLGSIMRIRTGSMLPVLGFAGRVGLRAAGDLVQKVALCELLELVMSLGLWRFHAGVVTWLGKKYFNWGALTW